MTVYRLRDESDEHWRCHAIALLPQERANKTGSARMSNRSKPLDLQPLNAEMQIQMASIVSEYRVLLPVADNQKAIQIADPIATRWANGDSGTAITLRDLIAFEAALIELQPLDRLRREVYDLRARYAANAPKDIYAAYTLSGPPNPVTASEEELRSDCLFCLQEIHRSQIERTSREQALSNLARNAGYATLGMCVVVGTADALLMHSNSNPEWFDAMVAFTALFGALGGFVSLLQRLQQMPSDADASISVLQRPAVLTSSWLSPLLGAVFAVMLFLIFSANMIEGSLFPDLGLLSGGKTAEVPFSIFGLNHTAPLHVADFAKLLIWSFIAGFAERLVPDMLDRFINEANIQKDKPNPVALPPAPSSSTDMVLNSTSGIGTSTSKGSNAASTGTLVIAPSGDISGDAGVTDTATEKPASLLAANTVTDAEATPSADEPPTGADPDTTAATPSTGDATDAAAQPMTNSQNSGAS